VGVLFADIADEGLPFVIPTLEVSACQFCKFPSGRFQERHDVFLSNVTDALVFGTAMHVSQGVIKMAAFKTYTTL
jgi:hypothetical protein